MIKNRILILSISISYALILFFCLGKSTAQTQASIPGDFPDPTVIFANNKYYAVGTSSEWGPHLPIYSSTDLNEWKQEGFVFSEPPEWVSSSFWAPEYFYANGTYYLYYSAKRKGDQVSCIGVATSKYPDRDFVDQGIVVAYGTESIDAYVVQEGNQLYMTWKAYGLDQRPIELIGSKLSNDGLRLEGEPFSLLLDSAKIGIEGQSFVKKDGYYYLFYSAGACCGAGCNYHVQAVRSKSFKGPYEDVGQAVLLGSNEDWKCMGHGTFVHDSKGDQYYLFHGYSKKGNVYTGREGLLAKLLWSDKDQPVFEFIPSTNTKKYGDVHIDFKKLKPTQLFAQWDFRFSKPIKQFTKNGLALSGTVTAENRVGQVLTWKPTNTSYSITTTVDLKQSSAIALKGLTVYGDINKAIGLGVKGDKLLLWKAHDKEFTILQEIKLPSQASSLEIKIETQDDLRATASYKDDTGNWKGLSQDQPDQFSIKDLAPWDRSPRPGLHVQGASSEKAVFKSFHLNH
ncbi:glycoside hydrolase family 43 protein [Sphingobacterium sp. HJSM2_6]|uniref:glycoside hydrolase family 43 protein n=1 Tax=Sphingobacterium sp. HJSM2_6 TaxID=3366264 RepID=UPI003BBC3A37